KQENDLLLVMRQIRPKNALDLFVGEPDGSPLSKDNQRESADSKLLAPDSTLPLDPQTYKKTLDRLPLNLRNLSSLQPSGKARKRPAKGGKEHHNTKFPTLGCGGAAKPGSAGGAAPRPDRPAFPHEPAPKGPLKLSLFPAASPTTTVESRHDRRRPARPRG